MNTPEFLLKRRLRFRIDGKTKQGELVIGNIRKVKSVGKSDAWACSWSLSETDPTQRDIYGEDAVAALQNCLSFLYSLIANYSKEGTEIWWIQKGDMGGLLTEDDTNCDENVKGSNRGSKRQ